MSETVTKKLMLFFPKCECEKPIIYHLVKDYNLVVNVYRAKVTPEEEGYLVLDVTGTAFDVTINYTGKGVTRDEDSCTHCGHCITHCPTEALYIAAKTTREVAYSEAKCIECLACLRVRPFGVGASAL